MSPTTGFVSFLALTLVLLAATVATGLVGMRRVHLGMVAGALASLGVTVYFAEQLGDRYDLESAGWITPVHLTLAKVTTASYLLPVLSGIRLWRHERARSWHRALAFTVLALTVVTAASGTAMILRADPVRTSSPPLDLGP